MFTDVEKEIYYLHSNSERFKKKVMKSISIIKSAFKENESWYLSCSFGKDSIALLDLVMRVQKCEVVYRDNLYALPCIYETIEKLEERINFKTNRIIYTFDFKEFLKEYGLPGVNRTKAQHEKAVNLIKKDVLKEYVLKNNGYGTIWGLRKSESKKRLNLIKARGYIYINKKDGLRYCSPIADWEHIDIWSYIYRFKVPYPDMYDKQNYGYTRNSIRNNSWITTDGADSGKIAWLQYNYPKYFDILIDAFPVLKSYT
jgi:phosphoadenosine phosphosulfate reductase